MHKKHHGAPEGIISIANENKYSPMGPEGAGVCLILESLYIKPMETM